MTAMGQLEQATIQQQCKLLRMPVVAAQCAHLSDQAVRERRSHLSFLEALLTVELEERERKTIDNRIRDAHLPRVKALESFTFRSRRKFPPFRFRNLLKVVISKRAEPIIFIGDSGTGKTHLLTGLCIAACRQRRRVRFATAERSEWAELNPVAAYPDSR